MFDKLSIRWCETFLWWFSNNVRGLYGLGDANHGAHVAKNNERRSQFSSSATLPHWHQKSWKKESSSSSYSSSSLLLMLKLTKFPPHEFVIAKTFFSLFATTPLLTLVELLLYSLISAKVAILFIKISWNTVKTAKKSAEIITNQLNWLGKKNKKIWQSCH